MSKGKHKGREEREGVGQWGGVDDVEDEKRQV